MAEPFRETIISALKTALEAVAVQAGDNTTVAFVGRYDNDYSSVDGKRPAVLLRWLGGTYSDASESERSATSRVEAVCLAKVNPHSEDAADRQVSLFAHDIEAAIAAMDFGSVGYTLRAIDTLPLIEEDSSEPVDGVRVSCLFGYSVDYAELGTVTS